MWSFRWRQHQFAEFGQLAFGACFGDHRDCVEAAGIFENYSDARGILTGVELELARGAPPPVCVFPMRSTMVSYVVSGVPRQFAVMWQKSRCSILFHLLVPGGK